MAVGYYRLSVEGAYEGQTTVNVLYYGNDVAEPFGSWSPTVALDIIDAFGESVVETFADALPADWTLTNLSMTYVDVRGVTDPTTYEVAVGQAVSGTVADTATGAWPCAILAFQTKVAQDADLPMKRSYIAFGPVTRGFIGVGGKFGPTALTALNAVATLLATDLIGAVDTYRPVRLGRTVAPAPIRVGEVLDCFCRPNASTRRSRKTTPSGP